MTIGNFREWAITDFTDFTLLAGSHWDLPIN